MIDLSRHGFKVEARSPSAEREKITANNAQEVITAWMNSKFNAEQFSFYPLDGSKFRVVAKSKLLIFEVYHDTTDTETVLSIEVSRSEKENRSSSSYQVFSSSEDAKIMSGFKDDFVKSMNLALAVLTSKHDSWTKHQISSLNSELAAAKGMIK